MLFTQEHGYKFEQNIICGKKHLDSAACMHEQTITCNVLKLFAYLIVDSQPMKRNKIASNDNKNCF